MTEDIYYFSFSFFFFFLLSEGGHRGFGFVEFEEARDAQAALDNMNNGEFFGRVIKCSMAKPMAIKEGSVRPSRLFFVFVLHDE